MAENQSCNGDCYCQYKIFGGTLFGCAFKGYCDFQAPRDSRVVEQYPFPCTCGQTIPCKQHPTR